VIDSLLPANIRTALTNARFPASAAFRPESANGMLVRGQAPGDQAVHTAVDIPVSAYSSGSEAWLRFVGSQANTDIFFKLTKAALTGDKAASDDDDDRD
jgi:alkaline phosphatase